MKKIFLFILLLGLPILASAYDIAVENDDKVIIYYNYSSDGKELSVTYLEKQSSSNSSAYKGSVVIPEEVTYMNRTRKVTSIGNYAFDSCSGLTSVTIPNSVTSIGDWAFEWCSGLTSVIIGNSVTSIGDWAFYSCSGLTSVTIPNSVTSIGDWAFEWCSGLTSVIIGNSVTSIGNYAFKWCSGLTSIIIPNSVTSIGGGAFYSCSGLTSVTIPNSVTSIGGGAFEWCSGLTSIIIPNSVTSIGDRAFYGCYGLTSVTIGNSVTSIGSEAFYGCSGLTSVTIGNSVTSIGGYAFFGCSDLTSVIIPCNITSIGDAAFNGCNGLTSVISLIENPFVIGGKNNGNTFSLDTFNNATLYVPKGTIDKYKATTGWKDFLFIEEGDGSGGGSEQPEVKKCAIPTISYSNKRLTFSCETEGVEYVSEIKDVDIKMFYDSSIDLSATYEISVYATKSGFANSDMATATLVWTEAIFTDTTPETPSSAKAIAETIPVLISAYNGDITVKSEANGQAVAVYTVDGQLLGNATVSNGQAIVSTTLQNGNIAVVNVGNKAVKIVMR